MVSRIVMMILDGIGDRPVKELGGKTPLEKANTPNLDRYAKEGVNGIMDTIAPGIVPGSDTGHLALLGYDPYEVYTGRGPFEASGLGMELRKGQVVFRCNFGTLEDGMVVDRRAGRIKRGTDSLAEAVNDMDFDVDFIFKESVEHRAVLIFNDRSLGSSVSDVDPHEEDIPLKSSEALDGSNSSKRTAELINKFTEKTIDVLSEHPVNLKRKEKGSPPANVILSRGAGSVPDMKPLRDIKGIKSAAIAGIPLVRGVCELAGMDIIQVGGATGGLDTDIGSIISAVVENIDDYDFILVNVKGPDISGHDGDYEAKVDFIERIDSALPVLDSIENTYFAFTGDHSTPITVKNHSGDPLPLVIYGDEVRIDNVVSYGERTCAAGGLGRLKGSDLLNVLMDLANRAEKFGA
ncbi:MAG: 2,3-bisphosphoglycerate-independent phosphoglycerate mutase [Thermoplasmata archaeon]